MFFLLSSKDVEDNPVNDNAYKYRSKGPVLQSLHFVTDEKLYSLSISSFPYTRYMLLKKDFYSIHLKYRIGWCRLRRSQGIVGSNPGRGHGCLSLVIVVYCQVEVSASG